MTKFVLGANLKSGQTLIGDSGGTSLIESVDPNSLIPGFLTVWTEHGPIVLDFDVEYGVSE